MTLVVDHLPERIASKIEVEEGAGGCWLWTAATANDYGWVSHEGRGHRAHRFVYELPVGPIQDGLTVDHRCRVKLCVNPEHLEPVTNAENNRRGRSGSAVNARKTHCVHGHPLAGDNLIVRANGWRRCRECERRHKREARARATVRRSFPWGNAIPLRRIEAA